MNRLVLAVVLVLAALPALAAEGNDPCTRGPSTVTMMGVDIQTLRCKDAIAQQRLGQMEMTILQLQAELTMAKKDAEAGQGAAEEVRKQWSAYFSAYIGATPPK